ncbi:DUF2000 family protein [Bosea sp. BIWAKO-01]|uniref:DUF2000 family protein n=1 Tax=Bosea sp. BIWAKO-01 TaxID=506668 RepID=UPI000853CA52|nr:DUF2000 family protein [Bosea sp. BIWAKO-01]
MIFAADRPALLRARRQAQERNLTCAAYVEAMFSTGHDAANREAFRVEPAEEPGLIGWHFAGPKRTWTRRPRDQSCILSADRRTWP